MAVVKFIYNVSYGDRYFVRGEVANLSSIDIENLKPYIQVLSETETENTKETKNETKPKKEGKNERK